MTIPDHPPLYGLVLSGGRSTRMGRDKGAIEVHGKSQRQYLFDELSAVCSRVFISLRNERPVPTGAEPVFDAFNIDGPLNGILSAIQSSPTCAWLAVAVDMPYVNRSAFQHLVDARDVTKVATCFFNKQTNLPEPLITIWEPKAFSLLKTFAESGQVSPRKFLSENDVALIAPPDPRVFYNMNFPGDLI